MLLYKQFIVSLDCHDHLSEAVVFLQTNLDQKIILYFTLLYLLTLLVEIHQGTRCFLEFSGGGGGHRKRPKS